MAFMCVRSLGARQIATREGLRGTVDFTRHPFEGYDDDGPVVGGHHGWRAGSHAVLPGIKEPLRRDRDVGLRQEVVAAHRSRHALGGASALDFESAVEVLILRSISDVGKMWARLRL